MAEKDWTRRTGKVAAASSHVNTEAFFFFASTLTLPKAVREKFFS